jgi:hypothetical protein
MIVSNRGTQFTLRFWEKQHEAMDRRLNFSSVYHPQMHGQTERVNQILEDMLRACLLKDSKSWDKYLPYAEFSYNNRYQNSLKVSPFESIIWTEVSNSFCFGMNLEKIKPLDQKYIEKQKGKFKLLERTYS